MPDIPQTNKPEESGRHENIRLRIGTFGPLRLYGDAEAGARTGDT